MTQTFMNLENKQAFCSCKGMYAVAIVGVHEWNGFAQKVKRVSQRQGDFNNILVEM